RHPRGRAVEPGRGRSAHEVDADRERRARRAGLAGWTYLRRLPFRQPDRRAAHPRPGPRRGLRRPRLGRQRGRPLARRDLRGGARKAVGVVTTTAGGATMVVDPLARRGVTIAPASPATLARLAAAGIEVRPARLVDLTVAGARYETVKSALAILLAAPEFDLLL